MLHIVWWLAYFVPMAGVGIGGIWWFWLHASAAVGEQVRALEPPDSITLDPGRRQSIFNELYQRRRSGCITATGLYAVVIAAVHPMYAPDRFSDTAGGVAFGVALIGGFVLGETYAATRASRTSRPNRRLASLTPRAAST